MIENLVERHLEIQNVDVKILSVSMKPGSKDRSFLVWIDIAFMHINLFAVLQVSVLTCVIVSGIIARARRVVPLHLTRPHRYFTRRNTPRLMDLPIQMFSS